jgi:uncharacterized NAD(P)/FAD-binding protein YdhS
VSQLREAQPATRVVVVGGGAAAVVTAAHVVRSASPEHRVHVHVVGAEPDLGPGVAYRTPHPRHTLNNYAARLSAVDGDPDHLLRWCARRGVPAVPTTFLQREVYGRYLREVFTEIDVPAGSALSRTQDTVRDIVRTGEGLDVHLAGGWRIAADKVVLALGVPPPASDPALDALGDRYHPDPWVPELAERVGDAAEVLVLGTGLTMVDVVTELHDALPMARFTAASRNGLLPAAHRRGNQRLHDTFHPGVGTLEAVRRRVQERIAEISEVGGDWRDVVDSVRASANDLWRGLSPEEQEEFVGRLARRWETARHRMPPDQADLVTRLRRSGRLRVTTVDEVDPHAYDVVVNATGPAPVPTRGWNRLVDTLLDRGTIRPHRLGLGLDLDVHGRVVDAQGRVDADIYAVGVARRGLEWEVSAVPDLRSQAARLADHVREVAGHAAATGAPGRVQAGTA